MNPSLASTARLDAPLRGIGFVLVGGSVFGVATTVGAGLYVLHHQALSQRERHREGRSPAG